MLRVNKKVEYGIIALLYLDGKQDKVASVREMATSCKVPETLLSKIMQSMKGVGFVHAVHGNQGGYRLEKNLSDISLLDLTEVLSGPVQVAECLGPEDSCQLKETCTIISPMNVLNQKIIQMFQQTSLESLSGRKIAL
jgi:Rrf2 family protein